MTRTLVLGALVLGLAGANANARAAGPGWTNWKEAKGLAASTGKLILVYSVVDQKGGSC